MDLSDQYRIVRPLGRGGMGEVFEVARVKDGRHFALKVFHVEKGNVAFLRERFQTEGRLLERLSHPHLAPIEDRGVWKGKPCHVMKLVLDAAGESATLEVLRRQGRITPDRIEKWYEELVDALRYCHRQGVVHRDVKLENVLVDAEGHAVLSDFGVAKIVGNDLRAALQADTTFITGMTTGTRPVMGSYWYLAPEIRRGEVASESTDWYALGVLFFRLLTGMWYEPTAQAFDLLLPHEPIWRERLENLLADDPAKRTPLCKRDVSHRQGGTAVPRRSRRRLLIGSVCVSLLVLCCGLAGWLGRSDLPSGWIRLPLEQGLSIDLAPVDAFHLGVTPVTRGQWRAVMGGTVPEIYKGSDQAPMTDITWEDATNFCARLSARFPAYRVRLPTLVEWQLAYRKGQTAPVIPKNMDMNVPLRTLVCRVGWFGQDIWGHTEFNDRQAWFATNLYAQIQLRNFNSSFPARVVKPGRNQWMRDSAQWGPPIPVALKPANDFGLHDMAGNVFEMVAERVSELCPHLWCDTEYGFQLGDCPLISPENPPEGVPLFPVLLGQPFTPGLPADELWSSYFPKMPHAGFRVAL